MIPSGLSVELKLLSYLETKQSVGNVNEDDKGENYQNSFTDIFRVVGPSKRS